MRRPHRLLAALAVPVLALLTGAGTPFPASIPLPVDFAPEGIAVGTGTTFYAGSLTSGDIVRGDLRDGTTELLVDETGGTAAGLKVDESRNLLVVAGGALGTASFYDARDGSKRATLSLGAAGTSLINDVAVTRDAAYFTDSFNPRIYRVAIAPDGALGEPETIEVTGPASPVLPPVGLNGITATPDGATLIVGNSGLNAVFTVDPATGESRQITIPFGPLPPSNDGILLDGRSLWVVANFSNAVLEVRLAPDLSSGEVVNTITNGDVGGLFRIPTTVAVHGDKLVLVNARFDLGLPPPFGPGAPPGTDFDVVQIDKP